MKSTKQLNIIVCMGSSCFARGNNYNLDYIENMMKENNLDITLELSGSRCEKNCASGPNIIINDKMHSKVTKAELTKILEKHVLENK